MYSSLLGNSYLEFLSPLNNESFFIAILMITQQAIHKTYKHTPQKKHLKPK